MPFVKAAAALLIVGLLGSAAAAQTSGSSPTQAAVPGVGAPVRDETGAVLGRVEAVITDTNGRPVQVVVRNRGVGGVRSRSRAIPIESLRPEGQGFVTPLRRAEFDLLPAVTR